jgi:hypothetical protein
MYIQSLQLVLYQCDCEAGSTVFASCNTLFHCKTTVVAKLSRNNGIVQQQKLPFVTRLFLKMYSK